MSAVSAVGAVGGLVVLVSVVRLVVAGRLRVRYAGLWLVVSTAVAAVALVPGLLRDLAGALGFVVPANLLFFVGLVLLVLVGVHLSVAVTSLEDRIQRLAEELVLLRDELRPADEPRLADDARGADEQHPGDEPRPAVGATTVGATTVGATTVGATTVGATTSGPSAHRGRIRVPADRVGS